jgi:hypothetical protein
MTPHNALGYYLPATRQVTGMYGEKLTITTLHVDFPREDFPAKTDSPSKYQANVYKSIFTQIL